MAEPAERQSESKGKSRQRRIRAWLLGGIVVVLLGLIAAQGLFNLWSFVPAETGSDTLLLYAISTLNFVAFFVFTFILLRSLLRLRRERRARQAGSRIQTRLLVYFIGLSLLPITAMAAFSYLFLNRSVEKWMGRLPENVVERVREQQREIVATQNQRLHETATLLATAIRLKPQTEWQPTLDQLRNTGELTEIEIVSNSGEVIAASRSEISTTNEAELAQVLEAGRRAPYPTDSQLSDAKGFDLASVPLTESTRLILVPRRFSDADVNDLIAGSQSEYQHLVQRQRKVRLLGLSTLGLMTLLLLFASTWVAIHLARGLAAPIKSLAEASKEVARGNLSHRVNTPADDELALLADSFNQMTAELEENRRRIEAGAATLKEKNQALEERRNYIETVLNSLSTGVVSLDSADCVTTMNAAAASILRLSESPPAWAKLSSLLNQEDRAVLERLIKRARRAGRAAEQSQLTRGSTATSIPVALTVTALGAASGGERGVVLVIDDLSELLTAQRAAAWSEVARRIAHEIKNPLTPIQLSAERIARQFGVRVNGGDHRAGNGQATATEDEELKRVVEECTSSITREVAGLKSLVDEFSRFARMPDAQKSTTDLNNVIAQAAALYEERLSGAELRLELQQDLPPAMLDGEQMKRVFVNLIDNALEALTSSAERRITIVTSLDAPREMLIAEVADSGEGVSAADFKRLFQPYFSTRGRGTGLGLAIVQRIISEHGGRIYAENNVPHGARFVIELPVAGL
ncbi:MAG TPA: ATP-binding protein [Pyrinomonadaceae bacterium]|nr:ATP-binding protein [Pyrinomonadaceae bacterium]